MKTDKLFINRSILHLRYHDGSLWFMRSIRKCVHNCTAKQINGVDESKCSEAIIFWVLALLSGPASIWTGTIEMVMVDEHVPKTRPLETLPAIQHLEMDECAQFWVDSDPLLHPSRLMDECDDQNKQQISRWPLSVTQAALASVLVQRARVSLFFSWTWLMHVLTLPLNIQTLLPAIMVLLRHHHHLHGMKRMTSSPVPLDQIKPQLRPFVSFVLKLMQRLNVFYSTYNSVTI